MMKKTHYEVAALAALYFPESSSRNARRRFMNMLQGELDLWRRLQEVHFRLHQRCLTPKQYEMIIDVLGQPEAQHSEYSPWERM